MIPIKQLKYSLDYSIRPTEARMAAVHDVLSRIDTPLARKDLLTMEDYILCGNLPEGGTFFSKHYAFRDNRYSNPANPVTSLTELIENPKVNHESFHPIAPLHNRLPLRPKFRPNRIDRNDPEVAAMPGMTELWASIDYLSEVFAANNGRIPFTDGIPVLPRYYLHRLYNLIKFLRGQQYFIYGGYRPWMTWYKPAPYREHRTDWADNFNIEDPTHVAAFIPQYADLQVIAESETDTSLKALMFDWQAAINSTPLSVIDRYLLSLMYERHEGTSAANSLSLRVGATIAPPIILTRMRELPVLIAAHAKSQRLIHTHDGAFKVCTDCGSRLPMTEDFFHYRADFPTHFEPYCVHCHEIRALTATAVRISHNPMHNDYALLCKSAPQTPIWRALWITMRNKGVTRNGLFRQPDHQNLRQMQPPAIAQ